MRKRLRTYKVKENSFDQVRKRNRLRSKADEEVNQPLLLSIENHCVRPAGSPTVIFYAPFESKSDSILFVEESPVGFIIGGQGSDDIDCDDEYLRSTTATSDFINRTTDYSLDNEELDNCTDDGIVSIGGSDDDGRVSVDGSDEDDSDGPNTCRGRTKSLTDERSL